MNSAERLSSVILETSVRSPGAPCGICPAVFPSKPLYCLPSTFQDNYQFHSDCHDSFHNTSGYQCCGQSLYFQLRLSPSPILGKECITDLGILGVGSTIWAEYPWGFYHWLMTICDILPWEKLVTCDWFRSIWELPLSSQEFSINALALFLEVF